MTTKPIFMPLNQAVVTIAATLCPEGFRVSEIDAPQSYEALDWCVNVHHEMVVYAGNSDRQVFGDVEVNHAFRAWHDLCHLRGHHPFTSAGERAAVREQLKDLRTLYGCNDPTDYMCRLVWGHVIGQFEYEEVHRVFPDDGYRFVKVYAEDRELAVEGFF